MEQPGISSGSHSDSVEQGKATAEWNAIEEAAQKQIAAAGSKCAGITLSIGDTNFSSTVAVLSRFPSSLFYAMLATTHWQPVERCTFFFDRNSSGFQHVMDYLTRGSLRLTGINEADLQNLTSQLDQFYIPYKLDKKSQGMPSIAQHESPGAKRSSVPCWSFVFRAQSGIF